MSIYYFLNVMIRLQMLCFSLERKCCVLVSRGIMFVKTRLGLELGSKIGQSDILPKSGDKKNLG